MEIQTQSSTATQDKALFVKMVLSAWDGQVARLTKLLSTLTDEELMKETAPGRNRGIYLAGHLTAVHDELFPLMGWGEKLYPQLTNLFIKSPDRSNLDYPSISEIKKDWNEINSKMAKHISQMSHDDWFARHNSVSADDFAKEPHRNKLNVIISRTNHLNYHMGQLIYLVKK